MNELSTDWLKIAWSAITGAFMVVVGYFLPVQNIILVLILFFAIDAFFGYRKAHKIDKEKFSQKKIWNTTVPRLGGSTLLIMMTFIWDDVHGQKTVATYNALGWALSGLLLSKTAFNLYYLTKWDVFKVMPQREPFFFTERFLFFCYLAKVFNLCFFSCQPPRLRPAANPPLLKRGGKDAPNNRHNGAFVPPCKRGTRVSG